MLEEQQGYLGFKFRQAVVHVVNAHSLPCTCDSEQSLWFLSECHAPTLVDIWLSRSCCEVRSGNRNSVLGQGRLKSKGSVMLGSNHPMVMANGANWSEN